MKNKNLIEAKFLELMALVNLYIEPERTNIVKKAYSYAKKQHAEQKRLSGEAFIVHPLETAIVLATLKLDPPTIASALLHDVVEDCDVSLQDISKDFGSEIAKLVDGVTKLKKFTYYPDQKFNSVNNQGFSDIRAENLRKMFVAMAEDIRVILIKFADRLHNMKTIKALPLRRRKIIAKETFDVYVPLADRLGISEIKWQLEDLAFQVIRPFDYERIANMIVNTRSEREKFIDSITKEIESFLKEKNLQVSIDGRPKNIFSIFNKIKNYNVKGRDQAEIYDLYALRVLVQNEEECYKALGIIHGNWRPVKGEFDDYIANPKQNMYQSLHTTVMRETSPIEIQIKTFDMHNIAEYGIAAHNSYKGGETRDDYFDEKLNWLRQLVEWQREVGGTEEFLESVKTDIFSDQVFVYTPKGEVVQLPEGSTPIDFAYKIHTELGHACVGVKVNTRRVNLNVRLNNGDLVEILTSKTPKGPKLLWLEKRNGFIVTANASQKIKSWYRKQDKETNITRGRTLLYNQLHKLNVSLTMSEIIDLINIESESEMFYMLGSGKLPMTDLLLKLSSSSKLLNIKMISETENKLFNNGIDYEKGNTSFEFGKCCKPNPKNEIIGLLNNNQVIMIHKSNCYVLKRILNSERKLSLTWNVADEIGANLVVQAEDRIGLLRDISEAVSSENVNISNISLNPQDHSTIKISFSLDSMNLVSLDNIIGKIEMLTGVKNVIVKND